MINFNSNQQAFTEKLTFDGHCSELNLYTLTMQTTKSHLSSGCSTAWWPMWGKTCAMQLQGV